MADITNIDIIPDPSGCGHATLVATVDGIPRSATISKADFKLDTPEDLFQAVLNRIRSHIKENLPSATFAQVRSDLQTRSFKV